MADTSGPAAHQSIRDSLSREENDCSIGQLVKLISFRQYVRIIIVELSQGSSSLESCFH